MAEADFSDSERERQLNLIREKYNWDKIAEQTVKVYERALRVK